ncbi:MAG: succinyl-diaminopimelate desuccinylase [Betaproteobacteria bacterium]|jgi:succinyl-diaminopimelate desuccinylase|nr:succinyl-diaminopimelate desuccinylase [Betaproteobacteria bacterium]NBP44947.1 succinyl-diaminopimelate desuccinylase [Betaproteobacteria bacterium]
MSDTLRLVEALIAQPSVTPDDRHCQIMLSDHLEPLGFECEFMVSGPKGAEVTNLWAIRRSARSNAPVLVFAGHTDVVPPGPREQWQFDPFEPTHHEGRLYGRGASDMKTSLAAMVMATRDFLQAHPDPALSIAYLLTSDEEGPAVDGTVIVCQELQRRGQTLNWCIVGEPTSVKQTGDMIKNGRRGTLSGKLKVKGIQGHVAYPHLADNPVHRIAPALAELAQMQWDAGNAHFPPTTWQVSNIHAGTGAGNIIPGECVVDFNFRFSTESSVASLQERLVAVLQRHQVQHELQWTLGGEPFLTPKGPLLDTVNRAILQVTGLHTEVSTTGGTSDGRFIAKICPEVIELGPPNASIHKVNEHVVVSDIDPLKAIYQQVLVDLHEQSRQLA